MGNPQHLEWLLEGVEAWNARREREDFEPNFSDIDVDAAFAASGVLNTHGMISLRGLNLGHSDCRNAFFNNCDLRQADFQHANLTHTNFRLSDLEGSNLRHANLEGSHFEDANLSFADLREANFHGAIFDGTQLDSTCVRTNFVLQVTPYLTPRHFAPISTDLSSVAFIDQSQVSTMDGDTGTILPPGLTHPPHWPDPEPPGGTSAPETKPPHAVSTTQVQKKLVENRDAAVLTSAALLDQIAEYRFKVYSDNQLACDHPEFRDELLAFLDQLSADIETLLQAIPAQGAEATEQQAEQAATWFDRFAGAAIPEWKKYLAPEALGKATVPSGIILTCGALGSLVSGMNPLGFGAGAVVGKLIVGEVKSGQAADKLKDMFDDPEDAE